MKKILSIFLLSSMALNAGGAYAGFFKIIDQGLNAVDKGTRIINRNKQVNQQLKIREMRELERQEAKELREQKLREYEEAKLAATEAERQEAERRKAVFDAMSQEEKEEYYKQQQKLEKKNQDASAGLALLLMSAFFLQGPDTAADGGSHCGAAISMEECHKQDARHFKRR